jgi:hypothetical protein
VLENKIEIQCDSKLEYSCLAYLQEKYEDISNIRRCKLYIDYYDSKKEKWRKYNPDFQFEINNKTYIVECKSEKIGSDDFWFGYTSNALPKKKALLKYCKDNNCEMIWYTQNIKGEDRRYKNILKMFIED